MWYRNILKSGNSTRGLRNNSEQWDGVGDGREVRERGGVGTSMADSC